MNDVDLKKALEAYAARTGHKLEDVKAVLFDMDGVLYDSMPGHEIAWMRLCKENGIDAKPEEFYAHEGRTGTSIINILFQRQFGHGVSAEEAARLYSYKAAYFKALGEAPLMPGAQEAVKAVLASNAVPVLVTGSGQASILDRLNRDYPGAFVAGRRVTAADVKHGKPDPEPYLMGMEKVDAKPWQSIAIDNAPLGVESASKSGAFTIGVRTGPLPEGSLLAAGADVELNSMAECTKVVRFLL